ncbi:MAG TPA: hypothetical protein VGJ05_18475 [Fimbriiglobus sp.]|jgi:hypothetical protein
MKVLVLGSNSHRHPDLTPQPHGLGDFRKELLRSGLEFDIRDNLPLSDFVDNASDYRPDIITLLINWDQEVSTVESVIAKLTNVMRGVPIVFLDQCDQTCSPFLPLSSQVNLFLKAQVLADKTSYTRQSITGYIFTDYLHSCLGYDLESFSFGASIYPGAETAIHTSWNLGVGKRLSRLLRLGRLAPPWKYRRYDFHCRLGLAPNGNGWYARYRRKAADQIAEATVAFRRTGAERVGVRRYLAEMALSQVVFSPFGWGEVCHRDFEAVALGALLLKPDMGHLVTYPNIYLPYRTYIPLKWDLSDLPDQCNWCMNNLDECRQIANNARKVLADYLSFGFLQDVRDAFNIVVGRESTVSSRFQ